MKSFDRTNQLPSLPRIASVTLFRNEADVLELFIKINTRLLTRMYLIDHHSNDGSKAIVEAMAAAGYPVQYVAWQGLAFEQAAAINSICHQVAKLDRYDYLLPLDADEFLDESQLAAWAALRELPLDAHATLGIRNYCATSTQYFDRPAPLHDLFRPRRFEPFDIPRVVMGNVFAKEARVTEGNHVALHPHLSTETRRLPLALQHVPVRSVEQITAKTVPAAAALRTKATRMPGEGVHWEAIANYIRSKDGALQANELANMALFYPNNPGQNRGNTIEHAAGGIGRASDVIELPELARVNVFRSLCGAMDLLEQQLMTSRSST